MLDVVSELELSKIEGGIPNLPGSFFPVFGEDPITAQRELSELIAYR